LASFSGKNNMYDNVLREIGVEWNESVESLYWLMNSVQIYIQVNRCLPVTKGQLALYGVSWKGCHVSYSFERVVISSC
jgi:hypothetical protein